MATATGKGPSSGAPMPQMGTGQMGGSTSSQQEPFSPGQDGRGLPPPFSPGQGGRGGLPPDDYMAYGRQAGSFGEPSPPQQQASEGLIRY